VVTKGAALAMTGVLSGCPGGETPTAQELCEGGTVPDGESTGTLSAETDDTTFTACVAGATLAGSAGDPLASITILGERFVDNERYGFLLRVTGPDVGTAEVGSSQVPSAYGQFDTDDGKRFLGDTTRGSGQIEITAISDSAVTGTFLFTLDEETSDETLTVAGGTFDVPVSAQ